MAIKKRRARKAGVKSSSKQKKASSKKALSKKAPKKGPTKAAKKPARKKGLAAKKKKRKEPIGASQLSVRPRLYTTNEISQRLKVSRSTVHRWIRADPSIGYRVGQVVALADDEIAMLIAKHC